MTFTTKQGRVLVPVDTDNRMAFGVLYFDSEEDANEAAAQVRDAGRTYNGGWFHGMPCGRDRGFDRIAGGTRLYAVTY